MRELILFATTRKYLKALIILSFVLNHGLNWSG